MRVRVRILAVFMRDQLVKLLTVAVKKDGNIRFGIAKSTFLVHIKAFTLEYQRLCIYKKGNAYGICIGIPELSGGYL